MDEPNQIIELATPQPSKPALIAAMQAAGLIIALPWPPPPAVSAAERERLAALLAAAGPLSSEIIADRGGDATNPPSPATQPAAQPF